MKMPEIEVESATPDIDYEIEQIVKAMLKSGTRIHITNKKLKVTIQEDEEEKPFKETIEAEISIKIQASDTLLEKAKEE